MLHTKKHRHKRINRLTFLISCILLLMSCPIPCKATLDSPVVVFTDYLPKYRTISSNFMIPKVEYTDEKLILHFIYIADKDEDLVRFYGSEREFTWRLTNSVRSENSSINTVTRLGTISNIRLNDELQREILNDRSDISVTAYKGDIITCEIHFKLMPATVRTVHLLGGDCSQKGGLNFRFNCNDLLLKANTSNILGAESQMVGSIKRFYTDINYVKYPDIIGVTSLAVQQQLEQKDQNLEENTPINIEKHLAPIHYMPSFLTEVNDLKCNQRVILSDVHFQENKFEFTSRSKAIASINIAVDYLTLNPKSKIILHGHTDIFGNAFNNLETSKQHISMVKKILAKSIDESRIITIHHGGTQPLARYKNGSSMNLRVEVEITCTEPGLAEKK